MIQENWASFLTQQGAQIKDDTVSDFGDPKAEWEAARGGNCICDLSPLALIRVRGEDAKTFLQNQLSNDINAVSETQTQLSAHCSAKGRVLSLFRVILENDPEQDAEQNGYLLQLPRERLQGSLQRLRMFVLMSKVTLEDTSTRLCTVGLSGPDSPALLASIGLQQSLDIDGVFRAGSYTIVRLPGNQPRFQVIADAEALQTLWLHAQAQARPVGYEAWLNIDINAGLPNVYEHTIDSFVPQMLNLHSLDGISFTKGCYPGQEVVARMHYLGKQKRRMYLGHIQVDQAPQPGDNLYAATGASEQSIGKIVHASGNAENGYDALAVIQVSNANGAEKDALRLNAPNGKEFVLKELPYPVELEGAK